jgi:hypothetical protein
LVRSFRHLPDGWAVGVRRSFPIPEWDPQPGGVDLFMTASGRLIAAMELKVEKVDEALWDIYKMVSLRTRPGVQATYVVIAASVAKWRSGTECTWLFDAGEMRVNSGDVFRRDADAWRWLLKGGRGRPTRVPVEITVTQIAQAPFGRLAGYELRAIRVEPFGSEWLQFMGEWPVGHATASEAVSRPVPAVLDEGWIDCVGYRVPSRFRGRSATDVWLAQNIPRMSDDQFEALVRELRRRGWRDDELVDRVDPHRP